MNVFEKAKKVNLDLMILNADHDAILEFGQIGEKLLLRDGRLYSKSEEDFLYIAWSLNYEGKFQEVTEEQFKTNVEKALHKFFDTAGINMTIKIEDVYTGYDD